MPADDDADDDTSGFAQPLPPDDRLWRHPSELNWGKTAPPAVPVTAPAGPPPRPSRPWGLALAAGTAGAVLTVGVIALVHGLQPQVIERPIEAITNTTRTALVDPGSVEDVAAAVGDTIARLEITSSKGDVVASAVFVKDGSYLVTNAHLLEAAESVRVVSADGVERDATVVGADTATDVAVLKVSVSGKHPATIGSTDELRVGQQAIAIGGPDPSGQGPSVTAGVVSALGRRVAAVDGTPLHGMIQTDAPASPEAAGGALVDAAGNLIGITTWTQENDGNGLLGLATPVELAMAVVDDIIATGKAHHVWLGIEGDDVDADTLKNLGITGGAQVHSVVDDSPAATAGLAADDVIVAIDDTAVVSMTSLVLALRQHHPDEQVTVHYLRDGKPATALVILAEK